MSNSLNIFGREIPLYGVCFFAGIVIAALIAIPLAKKRKIEFFDLLAAAGYALIFSVLGSKLLFILVSFPQIIELQLSLIAILKGGFVFYGGLLGGFLGILLYIKLYHLETDIFDVCATVLPLGHALGPIGCFFAGCCYGIPHDGFLSVTYHETAGLTPLEEPLLAIQLIEAAFLVLLFIIMVSVFHYAKKGTSTFLYLILYSVLRFILEFFRGDTERGLYFQLSTSQWISILLFIGGCIGFLYIRRKLSVLQKSK